jgi:S1-C subfamily serine protease
MRLPRCTPVLPLIAAIVAVAVVAAIFLATNLTPSRSSSTSAGHVMTNKYVVSGAGSFTVTTSTGKRCPGRTLVGAFPPNDLAVIKISAPNLSPATIADSSGGALVASNRAFLGIRAGETNGNGVIVGTVTPGGAAANAGMRVGDVIASVDGTAAPTVSGLETVLAELKPGQTVPIVVEHQDGAKATLHLTRGTYPGS